MDGRGSQTEAESVRSGSHRRHRAEGDEAAVTVGHVARNADLALEIATVAGAKHAAAAEAAAARMADVSRAAGAAATQAGTAFDALAAVTERTVVLSAALAKEQCTSAKQAAKLAMQQQSATSTRQQQSLPAVRALLERSNPVDLSRATNAETRAAVAEAVSAAALAAASKNTDAVSAAALAGSANMRRELQEYRQRAIDAEAATRAVEESFFGHRQEVVTLLRAVDTFAALAGDAGTIRAENQRLKAQLRALEAAMTPEQIAVAALPPGYRPPESFRMFPGAVNPLLKKTAPVLFAIRAMDAKELTLGEVVTEWVGMADQLADARDALRRAEDGAAKMKDAMERLELSVVDERTRRVAADNALHELSLRRIDPSGRHELDGYRMKLSLALDEKVALELKVKRMQTSLDAAVDREAQLKDELAAAREAMDLSAVSATLANMRTHYQLEEQRLVAEAVRLRSGWSTAVAHAEDLQKRVGAAELATAAATATAKRASEMAQAARRASEAAAKDAMSARGRCAELERELGKANRALADAISAKKQVKPIAAASTEDASAGLAKDLSTTVEALTKASSALAGLEQAVVAASSSAVDEATNAADAAATANAVKSVARGVQQTLVDTSRIRSALLQEVASKAVTIDDLQAAVKELVNENQSLREQLSEAQLVVERVAVPVAETVLGHAVPDSEASCPKCEHSRAALSAAEARHEVLTAQIDARSRLVDDLQATVAELQRSGATASIELRHRDARLSRLQTRLAEAHRETEAADRLRGDIARAEQALVAAAQHASSSDSAENDGDDDVADATRPSEGGADQQAGPSGDATAATDEEQQQQHAALKRILVMLLDSAKTLQAAQRASESAAERVRAAATDAEQSAASAATGGSSEDGAAVDDRRALVRVIGDLWKTALECRQHEVQPQQQQQAVDEDDDIPDVPAAEEEPSGPSADEIRQAVEEEEMASTKVALAQATERATGAEARLAEIEERVATLEGNLRQANERADKAESMGNAKNKLVDLYQARISQLEKKVAGSS